MKTAQARADQFAIGLSLACTLHCLALPVVWVLMPNMAMLQLENEAFHLWMIAAVIPSSLYALTLGCKEHKRYQLFLLGTVGIALLILALVLGEDRIGHSGEKILTVIGSCFVALGHFLNHRLCRSLRSNKCPCPSDDAKQ